MQAALYDIAAAVKGRDGPLNWNDVARESFQLCREALFDTTRLVHSQSDAPLRLRTDASNISIKETGNRSVFFRANSPARRQDTSHTTANCLLLTSPRGTLFTQSRGGPRRCGWTIDRCCSCFTEGGKTDLPPGTEYRVLVPIFLRNRACQW